MLIDLLPEEIEAIMAFGPPQFRQSFDPMHNLAVRLDGVVRKVKARDEEIERIKAEIIAEEETR